MLVSSVKSESGVGVPVKGSKAVSHDAIRFLKLVFAVALQEVG